MYIIFFFQFKVLIWIPWGLEVNVQPPLVYNGDTCHLMCANYAKRGVDGGGLGWAMAPLNFQKLLFFINKDFRTSSTIWLFLWAYIAPLSHTHRFITGRNSIEVALRYWKEISNPESHEYHEALEQGWLHIYFKGFKWTPWLEKKKYTYIYIYIYIILLY